MRIGRLEIRWLRVKEQGSHAVSEDLDGRDLSSALAVSDKDTFWLAVHQVINEAEQETIEGARNRTAETNKCIAAVGAGEGVCLVRSKLIIKRQTALKVNQMERQGTNAV